MCTEAPESQAPEKKVNDIETLKGIVAKRRECFVSDKLFIQELTLELKQLKREKPKKPDDLSAQLDARIAELELTLDELKSTRPKKERSASGLAIAGFVLAIFGFLVSGATLYRAQFSPAVLKPFVAPNLYVYYQRFTDDGCGPVALYVPVGFINKGARGGTVLRARMLIHRNGDPNTFQKEWTYIGQSFSADGSIGLAYAGPVGIGPTSVVGELIQFAWPNARPDHSPPVPPPPAPCPSYQESPEWLEGAYSLVLELWTDADSAPIALPQRTFSITRDMAAILADRRRNKNNQYLIVTFDNQLPATCVSPCKPSPSGQPSTAMLSGYVRPEGNRQVRLNVILLRPSRLV